MPVKDVFKVTRKTFLNPSAWFGYSVFSNQLRDSWAVIKNLFVAPKATRRETFAQAMRRLHLTEEDVAATRRNYLIYAALFLVLAVATVGFGMYLLVAHIAILGALLSVPVAGLFAVNALRYHFWAFQIQHRKLGCTLAEWRAGRVLGDPPRRGGGSRQSGPPA